LGNPTEDPPGDPIPDANGRIIKVEKQLLSNLKKTKLDLCGVKDTSSDFLKYLDKRKYFGFPN
jgi:DtxR family Mn-dependent transcriptional regulator